MARSMFQSNNLSNDSWDETIAYSIYILNVSPTTNVKNKGPQEAWSGTKTNVSHFIIFGYIAHAHVRGELRKNLDNMSENVFLLDIVNNPNPTHSIIQLPRNLWSTT